MLLNLTHIFTLAPEVEDNAFGCICLFDCPITQLKNYCSDRLDSFYKRSIMLAARSSKMIRIRIRNHPDQDPDRDSRNF